LAGKGRDDKVDDRDGCVDLDDEEVAVFQGCERPGRLEGFAERVVDMGITNS
jgi:hypothetical protein